MTRLFFKKFLLLTPSLVVLALPFIAWGAGTYQLLTPIGNFVTDQSGGDLSSYLKNMFRLGVAVATGLAVIMIVIGGIQYLSTDAITEKSEGKDRITSALWGLLLALSAYVILNTVNPALLNTNLNIHTAASPTFNPPGSVGQLHGPALGPDYLSSGPLGPGGVQGTSGGGNGIISTWSDANGNQQTLYNNGAIGVQNADGTVAFYDSAGNQLSGQSFSGGARIDSDGTQSPPYYDATRSDQTSYTINGQSLNAMTDNYVVVPYGSGIPMGTPIYVTNTATGQSLWAVAGDVGPAANGWGEVSTALGTHLGVTDGQHDAANGNLSFQVGVCASCH